MGVVFFPSLPFMGVMLFPSLWLGNASGGGGWCVLCAALPVFLSIFLPLFYTSPPLFSFLSSSFLHCFLICFFFFLSLLCPHIFFLFSFLPITLLFFFFFFSCLLSFSFVSLFFFFEGIACTECFSRCKRGHH